MIKLYRNLLCIIAILIVVSCNSSTNNTEPTETEKYFPLKTGNYWIYEYFEYDINGIGIGPNKIDSIVITNKMNYNGKNAFQLKVFRNNEFIENQYYQIDGNNLYKIHNFKLDTLPKMYIRENWLIFGKFNIQPSKLWNMFDTSYSDNEFIWENKKFLGTKDIVINGYYNDYSYRAYFGVSRYCMEFHISYDQLNQLQNIEGKDTTNLKFAHKFLEKIYYVENVGIYEWMLTPSSYSIFVDNIYNPRYTIGWHRKLLRYHLN